MKYLTIAEIEEAPSSEPIWALNGTGNVRTAGDLLVSVPKISGTKVDALKVPATWLATCLTEQIPRMQLLASSEFRQAVTRKLILLISKEDAATINQGFGAEEELQRLSEDEKRVQAALAGIGVHSDTPDLVTEANTMDPGFVIFFDTLKEKSDVEAYNAVRTRQRISRQEAQYLALHLVSKPNTVDYVRKTYLA